MNKIERYALEQAYKRGLLHRDDKIKGHLFDKQAKFREDKATFKAAQCSRRAGKSEMAAELLYEVASSHANSTALYVALTRTSAKNIMWPKLQVLKDKFEIDCTLLEGSLEVKLHKNNSRIWLVGADMANFIDRLRGGSYPIGIIDECQSFRTHIKELIDDVLTPAIADYNGSIYLLGTPGPVPAGYFYEATEKRMHGFSVHKWTMLDNPFMPNAKEFMQKILEKNSWTKENPTFRREYLNEWVLDLDSLFYKFNRDANVCEQHKLSDEYNRVLGIDYGYNDKTAFAILAYSDYSPKIFVEHTEAHGEMIPSEIAGRAQQLIKKYNPIKIVADTGGLGKSITEEMVRRYSIPVVAAEKTDKYAYVTLLNGEFIDRNLWVMANNTQLIHQYETLTKSEKDPTKEDPALPDDLNDAVLYSYRYIYAYHYQERKKPKTQQEIYEETEDEIWQTEANLLKEQQNLEWWEQ